MWPSSFTRRSSEGSAFLQNGQLSSKKVTMVMSPFGFPATGAAGSLRIAAEDVSGSCASSDHAGETPIGPNNTSGMSRRIASADARERNIVVLPGLTGVANSVRRKMIEVIEKGGRIDGTDDPGVRRFPAVAGFEEDHRRRADNAEAFHQGSAVVVVVGRVGTDQVEIAQAFAHCRIGKHGAIHDLALDAPLRRKIKNDRPAGLLCPCDRLVERPR